MRMNALAILAPLLATTFSGCIMTGCTTTQLKQLTYPSMHDAQQIADSAIESGEEHYAGLSRGQERIIEKVGGDPDDIAAIRNEVRQSVAAIREDMLSQRGTVEQFVRETVNPVVTAVAGIPAIIDDVDETKAEIKSFAGDIQTAIDGNKDTAREVLTIGEKADKAIDNIDELHAQVAGLSEKLVARIEALDATQISNIAAAAAADPTMKAVLRTTLAEVGFAPDEIAALRQKAEETGISIAELLTAVLGGSGATLAAARGMGSGGKVAKLDQKIEDLKTTIAAGGKPS